MRVTYQNEPNGRLIELAQWQQNIALYMRPENPHPLNGGWWIEQAERNQDPLEWHKISGLGYDFSRYTYRYGREIEEFNAGPEEFAQCRSNEVFYRYIQLDEILEPDDQYIKIAHGALKSHGFKKAIITGGNFSKFAGWMRHDLVNGVTTLLQLREALEYLPHSGNDATIFAIRAMSRAVEQNQTTIAGL